MTDMAFIEKGGGPMPADLLARIWERGNLTALQLRARLAETEAGSKKEEASGLTVRKIAVGGAFR